MYYFEPDEGMLETFLQDYPGDTPVVMLNLLRFRPQAKYPDNDKAAPCTGAEAYGRYSEGVWPLLQAHDAEIVWQGRPAAMIIGPQDKDWHLAILVRYPSAGAFVDMVTSNDYLAIANHRTAALADSRLIAHQEL